MIRFRLVFPVMTVITLLVLLAPLLLGLASAVFTYHGTCYGFTDGSWDCPWQEYASAQVFWASLLDIPLSLYLISCWLVALGLWLHQRRTAAPEGLPFSLVAVIPLGGCLGGACLISILPVFLRFLYL
ncbi:MAG: hypothetical protein EHM81_08280 [Chloroflexi bacterium]|nr:MAG: hypothetical protein EHM81_13065 [Chloroflexota bacterium]RPH59408.1 MAG: hypothetical protein EHM81_08280 [Chloroflexota bacterium]